MKKSNVFTMFILAIFIIMATILMGIEKIPSLAKSEEEFEKQEIVNDKITEDKDEKKATVTYINGKIVLTDELDSAIIKNFKVCGSKEIFQEEIDGDYNEFDDVRYDVHVPGVE